ncbi:MAG: hypothetical protein KC486_11520 [Myxococcales bacterium]|nr:hypothetical protein [Myxococcales bacterium]
MLTRSTPQFLSLLLALALPLAAAGCDVASASASSDDAAAKSTVATKTSGAADARAKGASAVTADETGDRSRAAAKDEASTQRPREHADSPADVGLGVDAASDRDVGPNSAKLHAALDKYASCAMQCSLDPSERDTDVESCLLTCRNVAESAGVAPDTRAHALVTDLDACIDTCNDKENVKPTNRSTCRLNCENGFKAEQAELRRGA